MKRKVFLGLLTVIICQVMPIALIAQNNTKEKVVFSVNMDCRSCEEKIMKNISFEKGVQDLKTDLKNNTVEVTYNSNKTDKQRLIAALKKIGYEAVELSALKQAK